MDQFGSKLVKDGIVTERQLENALVRQRTYGGRIGQNLIALGYISPEVLEKVFKKSPPIPKTVAETGLEQSFIADLLVKHALFMGDFKLADMAEKSGLSVPVVESVMDVLRRDKFIEVKGGTSYASVTYTFCLTGIGKNRATELFELCRYVGPVPVNIVDYRNMIETQTIKSAIVSEDVIKKAFSHLIIHKNILKRLGPAISSGKALFIYGPPGNGKTAIAETISSVIPTEVYIPHAVTVGGQIIKVFDPVNHVPVEIENIETLDRRWIQIKRPVVIAGGELSLRMLDLDFDPISKFYEASLQMKANNGIFIADDFGRQQIEPQHILNRWIVPLDRRIDFMNLHTGMKFTIPFDMLIIFCTNIEPKNLVDEAFLRRIPYKIKIGHPSEEEYEKIFRMVCSSNGIEFKQDIFDYLLLNYYKRLGVKLNSCHPRDIIEHIVINAHYYQHAPELSIEAIHAAWLNYFVEI
jgi:energy-coupling factor transporter ATP-binding protein EcfA2